jgi:hypothetical protein
MKNTANTQVKTKDGRIFFGKTECDVQLSLAAAGNPEVVAVRMPSGAWSTLMAKWWN